MMVTTLWIVSILLSIFACEQLYSDVRELDRLDEKISNTSPDHFRAWATGIICVGAVWGFAIALASLIGFIYP